MIDGAAFLHAGMERARADLHYTFNAYTLGGRKSMS
jgi:hypothetical protein